MDKKTTEILKQLFSQIMFDLEIRNVNLYCNTGVKNEEHLEKHIQLLWCHLKAIANPSKYIDLLCQI